MRLRRILQLVSAAIIVGIVVIQFVGPARSNPSAPESQSVGMHLQVTPQAKSILERSCTDCHSNNTRWPWYSRVAPVSWFVIDHVNHGRTHLNFSEWGLYTAKEQDELLHSICKEVKYGTMPLQSYLRLHTDAKLNASDVKILCELPNYQGTVVSEP
jgi:hypothetical protein